MFRGRERRKADPRSCDRAVSFPLASIGCVFMSPVMGVSFTKDCGASFVFVRYQADGTCFCVLLRALSSVFSAQVIVFR